MNTANIAAAFVGLTQKHQWSNGGKLSPEEVSILFAAVSAAGFELSDIVVGQLRGNYSDGCGGSSEKTFAINGTCPYKVIRNDGEDHYRATGWLDSVLSLALTKGDSQERINAVQHEIERSVPLKPIQLTAEGDFLKENSPYREYLADHTREDSKLERSAGDHMYCGGCMDRKRATETHDAIVCRSCHLRVLFPKEITTYGELRRVLASKFTKAA